MNEREHITQREAIIKSDSGKRMISMVSPIYDESYVMCWIYEAIGRQFDVYKAYADELKAQVNPRTATWAINLWEQGFGITPPSGATLQERRDVVLDKIMFSKPFTPYRLKMYIEQLTGGTCEVEENIAPYTFGVYITTKGQIVESTEISSYINRYKPSHLACELAYQETIGVNIGVETGFWIFTYPFAGTLPEINTVSSTSDARIEISPSAQGHRFAYPIPGKDVTGKIPETAVLFADIDADVEISPITEPYSFSYGMTGDAHAGAEPEHNTMFAEDSRSVAVASRAKAYSVPYQLSGAGAASEEREASAEYVMTSGTEESSIRASPSGKAYSITYVMCGAASSGMNNL